MKNIQNPKIAIVHDQITQYGGAERTLEQLIDIFPTADIFTGYCKPQNVSKKILDKTIFSGLGGKPVWVQKLFNYMSFLMPFVFESFDLRQYDIIISEGTAWPKGVITNSDQLHISYVYTPPRFLYGYATEGQKRELWYYKPFLKVIDHLLRLWDFSAAQRPDYILSISQEIAKRVKKFYGRESTIIYPPVDLAREIKDTETEEYYLCVSRLAAYKNIDLLIKAFNTLNLKIKIAGTGKEEESLKTLAGPNVIMTGFVSDDEKKSLLENCKGFIFPTDHEDFGIVTVEALSYGKPVLAHASGGQLEIIEDGVTGMFFEELKPEKLSEKIQEFNKNIKAGLYSKQKAIDSAKRFSSQRFAEEFGNFVKTKWKEKQNA